MDVEERIRVAELVATLSLATDHWGGSRAEQGLRSALIASRLAETVGMSEDSARDAYYLAMLRTVGCVGDGDLSTFLLGEDVGTWGSHLPNGSRREVIASVIQHVGQGAPPVERLAKVTRALIGMREMLAFTELHCETGRRLASRLGVGARVANGLGQVFERWDGRGRPTGLKFDDIDRAVCVAHLATDAQAMLSLGGPESVTAMVHARHGKAYAPDLADALLKAGAQALGEYSGGSIWPAVMQAEPGLPLELEGEAIDEAIAAIGEYADMKSAYFSGHSCGVARIAGEAAQSLGLTARESRDLRRAGHLHDLGRASVPAEIWNKIESLTQAEQERIRMHSYVTERILSCAESLSGPAAIASMSHERLDDSGYHRRLPSMALPTSARIIAAADVYQALTEPRPHRAAFSVDQAAEQLRTEVANARLDSEAVEAVLAVGGHVARRSERPAGLSPREVQVLRLVAGGLTNKEIASNLELSPKTVSHHLQHAFTKIGVRTRSAAGLFAMRHDLVRDFGEVPGANRA